MNITRRNILASTGLASLATALPLTAHAATTTNTELPTRRNIDKQFIAESLSHTSTVSYILPQPQGRVYIRAITRKNKQKFYAALIYQRSDKTLFQLEKRNNWNTHTFDVIEIPRKISNVELTLTTRGRQETHLEAVLRDKSTGDVYTLAAVDTSAAYYSAEHNNYGYSLYANAPSAQTLYKFSNTVNYHDYVTSPSVLDRWGEPVFDDTFRVYDPAKWRIRDNDCLSYDRGWITKDAAVFTPQGLELGWQRRATPRYTRSDGLYRSINTAYLDTIGTFSQEHGRWEARMKIPASLNESQGLWGGLWLRPDNTTLGTEIDIAESYGQKSPESVSKINPIERTEATLHFDQTGRNKRNKLIPEGVRSLADEWHVWAVEKTPESVAFFFDDQKFHEVLRAENPAQFDAAFPAGMKFNIRLNTQAGNKYWGWVPDNATYLPASLKVDYVRAWYL